jgi:hypothetical protein
MKWIPEKVTLDSGKVISIDRFNTKDGKYQMEMNDVIPSRYNEHWHVNEHVKDDHPVWLRSFRTKASAMEYVKRLYQAEKLASS